jgi:hypothetical protein
VRKVAKASVATLSISALLLLSGCGAGPDAQTRLSSQLTDGIEANIGDLRLVNVLLVAQPDGSAVLVGTVVNNGMKSDRIGAITANSVDATLTPFAPALNIGEKAVFSGDSANAIAIFPELNAKIGDRVPVEFTFSGSGKLKVDLLVREKSAEFASVSGAPLAN